MPDRAARTAKPRVQVVFAGARVEGLHLAARLTRTADAERALDEATEGGVGEELTEETSPLAEPSEVTTIREHLELDGGYTAGSGDRSDTRPREWAGRRLDPHRGELRAVGASGRFDAVMMVLFGPSSLAGLAAEVAGKGIRPGPAGGDRAGARGRPSGWSTRFSPTAGRSAMTSMSSSRRGSAGPIPLRIKIAGDWIAPAQSTTSAASPSPHRPELHPRGPALGRRRRHGPPRLRGGGGSGGPRAGSRYASFVDTRS